MFELLKSYNGYIIIAAVIFLAVCAYQSHEANKMIKDVNAETASDWKKPTYPLAPFGSLIFVIILLLISLITPMK
jgi:hypothetical protein